MMTQSKLQIYEQTLTMDGVNLQEEGLQISTEEKSMENMGIMTQMDTFLILIQIRISLFGKTPLMS